MAKGKEKGKEEPAEMVEDKETTEPDEEMTIDMTQARVLEPLPPDKPYLMAVSKWTPGKSAAGGRKLHYELTVAEPADFANRKVMEDLSLDNEFTLGRFMTLLRALGFEEEDIKKKDFRLPKEDDVLGMQLTVFVRTESSEQFGDRSRIRRLRPAAVYSEAATY